MDTISPDFVRLKGGNLANRDSVRKILDDLERVREENLDMFNEMVKVARSIAKLVPERPGHVFEGDTDERMLELTLHIVSIAVTGEGNDVEIGDPYEGE